MRRPRHEIEAEVPIKHTPPNGGPDSRPQIRRQLERICESLSISYDDLVELHVKDSQVLAVVYARNDDDELYRDQFDRIAIRHIKVPIDVVTFKGDEGDI